VTARPNFPQKKREGKAVLDLDSPAADPIVLPSRARGNLPPGNHMLAAMPPATRRLLGPHLRPVRLERGAVLLEPGLRVQHVWFPHDCVFSVMMMLECGASADTCTIGREGMMGYLSSIRDGRAMACGVVRIGGLATRVDRNRFVAAFEACPEWRHQCLRYAGLFIAQVLQSVGCNAHHSVEARLARQILILHDRIEQAQLPVTHDFLAEMLGTSRSTVTLAAKLMQGGGLIEQRRGAIVVRHRSSLEAAACECYGAVRCRFDCVLQVKDGMMRAPAT
jgi:CRP-like cAMP-binding protein